MTTPNPHTTTDGDNPVTARDALSAPADEEPTPEENALAQPQYPTT